MVAQRAALALGDRTWALVLCGGAAAWPSDWGPGFEERADLARAGRMDENAAAVAERGLSEQSRAADPARHGLLLALISSHNPEAYAESALATGAGSMRDLERLACPVLAFAGSEDPVTPPAFAEAIAEAAPRGESAVLEGAAHWCMLERPEAVNEALFGFLDRHRPAG
jgi:pimeloyl-ACP methyl ester carboxylesterase